VRAKYPLEIEISCHRGVPYLEPATSRRNASSHEEIHGHGKQRDDCGVVRHHTPILSTTLIDASRSLHNIELGKG
jgi:hypothetical protein